MSLDAIKQVTEVEEACAQRRAEAVQLAKKTAADAERAGQALLESQRAQARAQVQAMLAQAESRAAGRAGAVREEAARSCTALKAAAETHLDEAVEHIVRRVVSIS